MSLATATTQNCRPEPTVPFSGTRSVDSSGTGTRRRSTVLRRLADSIEELRSVTSVRQLIEMSPAQVCLLGFDHAMVSRVDGSTWSFGGSHSEFDPSWATTLIELATSRPQRVFPTLVEAEMMRRRIPLLVPDARHDPRVHRGLLNVTQWGSYVAAPIMPEGRVIGFLHATRTGPGGLDDLDRDVLALFAAQFGRELERVVVQERYDDLRRSVDLLTQSIGGMVDGCVRGGVEMPSPDVEDDGWSTDEPVRAGVLARAHLSVSAHPDNLLTRREVEVLQQMAAGYTNTKIASRLVISEGTVKSHVKHILRKLGAANRAEAVSKWLRAGSAAS